ncbi:unnamed protein product [Peronospora belbahrii]|uniref:Uncharacterized protein n=1 Tax=Peronospora belbahrii TaxID=622444 RepID=A0AAU9L8N1_9STRA|nr:unnamed protein product [Peronospora belbahrii]
MTAMWCGANECFVLSFSQLVCFYSLLQEKDSTKMSSRDNCCTQSTACWLKTIKLWCLLSLTCYMHCC